MSWTRPSTRGSEPSTRRGSRTKRREGPSNGRAAGASATPGVVRRVSLGLTALAVSTALYSCSRGNAEPPEGLLFTVGRLGTGPGAFRQPRALAVAQDGRFYVADRTGRIQLFAPDGTVLRSWFLPEYENGQPVGLAVEEAGTLVVNDSHYQRLLRYTPDGGTILASYGSYGTGPGQFTFGRDVVVDSDGNLYAGDYGGMNDRVLKFSAAGEFIREWGRMGSAPGEFDRPQGMDIERRDGTEYLLVADCNNHRIQRFDLDGRLVSLWGEPGTEPGRLRFPMSVAVGKEGAIYVCEWGNNRIQKFDAGGRSLGVWGRAGRRPGEFMTPWDIDVGPAGKILVADYGNHRIQVFRWPPS